MKAILFDDGPAFRNDLPPPKRGDADCLIKVHLVGISWSDLRVAEGAIGHSGVMGHEFVGTVAAGPPEWMGKRVVGEADCVCRKCDMCASGLAHHCRHRTVLGRGGRDGCFAEFVSLPERNLHLVPGSVSDEEAVFADLLSAAFQVLVQCPIDSRQSVVVLGSGRLGLLVAQVLKETRCKLIVVGRNPAKLAFCDKFGVQGNLLSDFVPRGDRDVVVECTGSADGLELAARTVRPRGTIVLKSRDFPGGVIDPTPLVDREIRLLGSRRGPFSETLHALARKTIDVRSFVSRVLPIEQAQEAFDAAHRPNCVKVLMRIDSSR